MTSKGYQWLFSLNQETQTVECEIRIKTCCQEEYQYLENIQSIELITKQSSHTYNEYDGTSTTIPIVKQIITIQHSTGVYEFPYLPVDFKLQQFLFNAQSLLSHSKQNDIHSFSVPFAQCIIVETDPFHSSIQPFSVSVALPENDK